MQKDDRGSIKLDEARALIQSVQDLVVDGPRAALIQRRGPDRAKHISRPQSKAKRPAAVTHATQSAETSGTDDWGAY